MATLTEDVSLKPRQKMAEFEIVEDDIWNTPAVRASGNQLGPLAQALLAGKTVFIEGGKSSTTFNPYYSIANRKGYRLEVRKIEQDGKIGRIGRFVKKEANND
jgi:hypothetical protein